MSCETMVKNIILQSGGVAKTEQFRSAGIENYTVCSLCEQGVIKRIKHGYYQLAKSDELTEAQILSHLLPGAVLCLDSALFCYGYSDFVPRLWTIAVPRTFSRTRLNLDAVPLKVYYVQEKFFELGKTTIQIDGAQLLIYDRERTICDCFKYRTKMDNELFNKAMNAYAADDLKDLGRLSVYAKEMGMYQRVMSIMEVLVNG